MNCYHLPILRYLIPFLIGIILSHYFGITSIFILGSFVVGITVLSFLFFKRFFSILALLSISIALSFIALSTKEKSANNPLPTGAQTGTIIIDDINKQNDRLCNFTFWHQKMKFNAYALIPDYNFLPSDTLRVKNIYFQALNVQDSIYGKYNQYLSQKGIRGTVFIKKENLLGCKKGKTVYAKIYQLRRYLSLKVRFQKVFEEAEEGIFLSLLLGEKSYLEQNLKVQYQQAGIIHVLAISGLHVGILFLFLEFSLRLIPLIPPAVKFGIIAGVLIFYALLSGLSPSVLRACLMCVIIQFARLIQAKNHPINTVLSSAFLLLIFKPDYLFDVGFQLSYTAVFFILYGLAYFKQFRTSRDTWKTKLGDALGVNLLAFSGTTPLLLYHFNCLYFISLLSGLLLVPLISIVVIVGISGLIFSELSFVFKVTLQFCNYLLVFCNQIIGFLAGELSGELTYQMSLSTTILLFLLLLVLLTPLKFVLQKLALIALFCLSLFISIFLP